LCTSWPFLLSINLKFKPGTPVVSRTVLTAFFRTSPRTFGIVQDTGAADAGAVNPIVAARIPNVIENADKVRKRTENP